MSATPLDRYRKLMNELLIVREADGGTLPDEVESSYVERLDELWWTLSESEQKEYEAELAGAGAIADRKTSSWSTVRSTKVKHLPERGGLTCISRLTMWFLRPASTRG